MKRPTTTSHDAAIPFLLRFGEQLVEAGRPDPATSPSTRNAAKTRMTKIEQETTDDD